MFTQPWPAAPSDNRRDHTFFYKYRADRARRTLRGIEQQVAKAEKAVAGKIAVKRNRFVRPTGATKTVNRALESKARSLAGIKGYVTNLPDPDPELVISVYSRLLNVERSYRMSKTDLAARPTARAGAAYLDPGVAGLFDQLSAVGEAVQSAPVQTP